MQSEGLGFDNKRRKTEGISEFQVQQTSDFATRSRIKMTSHCTQTQMGQGERKFEGRFVAETGIVDEFEPKAKTYDPKTQRGQIKISDFCEIIKTHCTQPGAPIQSHKR